MFCLRAYGSNFFFLKPPLSVAWIICGNVLSLGKCLRQRNVLATWCIGDMNTLSGTLGYHIHERSAEEFEVLSCSHDVLVDL